MKNNIKYWWDFGDECIIVESNDRRFPVVKKFPFDPNGGVEAEGELRQFLIDAGLPTKVGQASAAAEKAEKFISDLCAGREGFKRMKEKRKTKMK